MNQVQPGMMNNFLVNQNMNPNIQNNLQPLVNSFISGLLMNNSSTPNEQIQKGKIEIIEGILDSLKKSQSNISKSHVTFTKSQTEDEKMEKFLKELNNESQSNESSEHESYSYLEPVEDKKWIASKVFHQRKKVFRKKPNYKILNNSEKKTQKFFKLTKKNDEIFSSQKFISLDITVNYLNHSKLLKQIPVNPHCKIDLLIEGILKKVDLFGNSLKTVKSTAEMNIDNETVDNLTTIKSIENIESSKIILNIDILFKKEEGKILLKFPLIKRIFSI
jgi:hypothetical protein